jgi:hypothetical protein
VVEVMVDTDVVPVAPHLVIGASQAVVHPAFSSRLLAPPTVVVAIAVQCTWQLLTVWSVQEEDEEDSVSVDEDCLEAGLDDFGSSMSLSASTIVFRLCCNFFTVSTVSFVPLVTSSFNLLVVSTTQLRSEKAVLNKPPQRLRGRSCPGSLRRRCPLHGSTPSVGFENLPSMSTALGRSLPSSLVTAVTRGASGVSIQLLRSERFQRNQQIDLKRSTGPLYHLVKEVHWEWGRSDSRSKLYTSGGRDSTADTGRRRCRTDIG